MLEPPQPAVYLFVLDDSLHAVETEPECVLPVTAAEHQHGDSRTKIGFITLDSTFHLGPSQPSMLLVSYIEDIFLPTPDSLLVNLSGSKALVQDLLKSPPTLFQNPSQIDTTLPTETPNNQSKSKRSTLFGAIYSICLCKVMQVKKLGTTDYGANICLCKCFIFIHGSPEGVGLFVTCLDCRLYKEEALDAQTSLVVGLTNQCVNHELDVHLQRRVGPAGFSAGE